MNPISNPDQQTRPSLLGRLSLSPADPAAWAEFAERYGRQVFQWCRRWNLQSADAEDVTQSVLLDVARGMKDFRYDPCRSFRAWLKTLTHRAWCDWLSARKRAAVGGGPGSGSLETLESRDDLIAQLEREHRRSVFEAAALRVRTQVKPTTWEAFRMVAIEGKPGTEAAVQLGLTLGAVYVARCKVQKLLALEARRLDPDA